MKQPYTNLDEVVEGARHLARTHRARMAAVLAEDVNVLAAIRDAYDAGFATGILIGSREKIRQTAEKAGIDISPFEIVHCVTDEEAAKEAMKRASAGAVEVLMKGKISTPKLLKTLLAREYRLRLCNTLSHVAVVRTPAYPKLFGCSDGGMVMVPTLAQKVEILQNILSVWHALGISRPRVAVLAAVNEVVTDFSSARDAAILSHMGTRGVFGEAWVDGPLTVDTALSPEAAARLPFKSEVAGQADILLADSIETGNMLMKGIIHFGVADFAGLIVGAKVPVSLVSRADSARNKKLSLALAVVYSLGLRGKGGAA